MKQIITFYILALLFYIFFTSTASTRPNIIFILADDLGRDDVSFNGSPQIPTPNIDALAASGIILKNYYATPLCTPSRASLMTGRYAIYTGLQHYVVQAGQASGLPLNYTIMPEHFKGLGYSTHMIGKWHLGYYKKKFTPIYRGFDSFFGYWNGAIDYYDYTFYGGLNLWGIDFHDGLTPVRNLQGKYITEVFTEKAEEIIERHNSSMPLFLYLAHSAPHSGNPYQYLQAPPEYVEKFKHIKDLTRRTFAGTVSALDTSVGKVFAALHRNGMLDNSIIVFASDNGAEVEGVRGGYGSNWPLRGAKGSMWEGGSRVAALVWSPLLRLGLPRTSTQRMHISDWLPTLFSAAGGNVKDLGVIDGKDMWRHLVENLPSPRTEILLNVDPIYGMSALIRDDYKLVNGTYTPDGLDLWYGPSGRENFNVSSLDGWVWKNGSIVKDILEDTGRWLLKTPDQWRKNVTIDCGSSSRPSGNGGCNATSAPCLFNITGDPCEYHNLALVQPQVTQSMINRIRELNSTSLYPMNPPLDPKADPRCHGFYYVPWLDEENAAESNACMLS